MRKVVIDTNILVSALLSSHEDSATVKVLRLLFSGRIIPVITADIVSEYSDVLSRSKFGFPKDIVSVLLAEIQRKAIIIAPSHTDDKLPDEKDRPFFEAMLFDDEYFLVTGNTKHFPEHKRIMTARRFIDLIEQDMN